ncbi:response regulator [Gilvimarinus agarilyticus]|uniref:response regulator n=1 Tax=unclassified Gilvimarinus TaxID=2642066 RepID=UPI001C092AEC|nr:MULTISPECIES: response regulator [unclassified Gilvimarinus]MBU2884483.1 response regulator [Gilvimarinus agarilyticus]MDO6569619.1 response regulator [Gilvimarinus sp. 2_MG-2023]MDO6748578.1 response regulator [Gilvimarinus sp. 1_MG-2023]
MSLNTILYVEDEPDIRTIAQLALETVGGFTLISCASGSEAVAYAQHTTPDLILLDVMMPEMDGPETLRLLRERPNMADVPAIFMTAKVQPSEVAEYLSIGAVDVIAKPFDPLMLAEQINSIWSRTKSQKYK